MQSILISDGNYVEDPNHNCTKNLNIIGYGNNVLFTLNSLYIKGSTRFKILSANCLWNIVTCYCSLTMELTRK